MRKEVKRKAILPPSQIGFRRDGYIVCVDNIYVLNYLINKAGEQKERGVVIMFVDFKAAFDSVERKVRKERKVVRAMRDRRVKE